MAQVSGCIDPLLYCFLSAEFRKDLQMIAACRLSDANDFADEIDRSTGDGFGTDLWSNAQKLAKSISMRFTFFSKLLFVLLGAILSPRNLTPMVTPILPRSMKNMNAAIEDHEELKDSPIVYERILFEKVYEKQEYSLRVYSKINEK